MSCPRIVCRSGRLIVENIQDEKRFDVLDGLLATDVKVGKMLPKSPGLSSNCDAGALETTAPLL